MSTKPNTSYCDYCGAPVNEGDLRYGPAIPGPRHWECNNVKNGQPSSIEDCMRIALKELKENL